MAENPVASGNIHIMNADASSFLKLAICMSIPLDVQCAYIEPYFYIKPVDFQANSFLIEESFFIKK